MVGRKFHSFWNENLRGENASFCIDFEKFVKFDLNVAYKQLWLLEKDPSMWERERALLVEGESVYRFVKDYSAGHIRMDGTQPWIVDILMNKTTYKFIRDTPLPNASLSCHFLKRICSALLRFQEAQYDLLNKQLITKLADMPILKDYKANIRTDTPFASKRYVIHIFSFSCNQSKKCNSCDCIIYINTILCHTNLSKQWESMCRSLEFNVNMQAITVPIKKCMNYCMM